MQLCTNPSFEQQWTDLPPVGTLTNQQPAGFSLTIRPLGTPLLSTGYTPDDPPRFEVVALIPECVHKLRAQMPDADRRILDGDVSLQDLRIRSLQRRPRLSLHRPQPALVNIAVPVEVHNHGDGSPGAAVWRLIVDIACLSLAHLRRRLL